MLNSSHRPLHVSIGSIVVVIVVVAVVVVVVAVVVEVVDVVVVTVVRGVVVGQAVLLLLNSWFPEMCV